MSGGGSSYVGQLSVDGNWRWDGTSWQPIASDSVPRPLPQWLNARLTATATWLTLVGVLIVGLIADQAFRAGAFGLAASVALAFAALVLVFVGRLVTLQSRLLAGAAVLLGAWL